MSMNPKQKRNKKEKLTNLFGSDCFWCSKNLSKDNETIDHLIPLSRGGSNNLENLRLVCFDCNQKRGNSLFPPG